MKKLLLLMLVAGLILFTGCKKKFSCSAWVHDGWMGSSRQVFEDKEIKAKDKAEAYEKARALVGSYGGTEVDVACDPY